MRSAADVLHALGSFMGIKMPSKESIANGKSTSGATYISDTVATTKELLATPLGQKMKDKGVCYVRKLPDLAHFQNNPDTTDSRLVFNYWQVCPRPCPCPGCLRSGRNIERREERRS
jgi:hypothetical protein